VITLTISCVALVLLALIGLGWPLLRAKRNALQRGQFDRAVYRDQLTEIDRDLARGVLDIAEADTARLEVQRRLLGVRADVTQVAQTGRSPRLAFVTAVLVAGGAGGLYAVLGAPTLEDVPHVIASAQAQTVAQAQAPAAPSPHDAAAPTAGKPDGHGDYRVAAEKLREKLKAEPNNAEGWELYAHTESRIGDYQLATDAYRRAIDLGRKTPSAYDGLGEMLVLGSDGIVLPPAKDAFQQALRVEPKNPIARFYLALADSQAGEARKAVDAWVSLAADMPADDQMREEIARRIDAASRSGGFEAPKMPNGQAAAAQPSAGAAAAGPTPEQMAAAANMSQADRDKMIQGMIDQLAARLVKEPNDGEGWLKLANAYAAQGETDKAVNAFDHASQLKPKDPTIKLEAVATMIAPLQPTDMIPAKAVTMLHEVAALAPDAPEVLWYLGVVDARQGRPEQARQSWTKLLGDLDEGSQDRQMVQSAIDQLGKPDKQ